MLSARETGAQGNAVVVSPLVLSSAIIFLTDSRNSLGPRVSDFRLKKARRRGASEVPVRPKDLVDARHARQLLRQ